jgi:hypothetical protein
MTNNDHFFYDEFFSSDDDPGVPVDVVSHGKTVTIHLKRTVSLEDTQRAFNKAATFKLNKQTGQKQLQSYDEQAAIIETLAASIRSWPFKYRDGKAVPITANTVKRLDATVILQLKDALDKMYAGRQEDLHPFVNNSGDPS